VQKNFRAEQSFLKKKWIGHVHENKDFTFVSVSDMEIYVEERDNLRGSIMF